MTEEDLNFDLSAKKKKKKKKTPFDPDVLEGAEVIFPTSFVCSVLETVCLQEEAAPAPAEEEAPVKEKKEKKKVVFDAEDSANVEDIDLESFGKKKKKKKREGLEDLNDVKEALPEDDDDDIDLENFGKKKGGKCVDSSVARWTKHPIKVVWQPCTTKYCISDFSSFAATATTTRENSGNETAS